MVARISRKESRKAARKLKKAKRFAYACKKPLEDVLRSEKALVEPRKKRKKNQKSRKRIEQNEPATAVSAMESEIIARKQHRILVRAEERETKRFARKLGLNKRRNKSTLPKLFVDSGLDYILEVCDRKQKNELEEANTDRREITSDEAGSNSEISTEEIEECETEEGKFDGTGADIYGRERDSEGNIVPFSFHKDVTLKKLKELEQNADEAVAEGKERLKKQICRLVNRLSEKTLVSSSQDIGQLFQSHSRNEVKQILSDTLMQAISMPAQLPERLIIEYGAFLSLIYTNVSSEITAHIVEKLSGILNGSIVSGKSADDDKTCLNQISVICTLYRFKVISGKYMIELVEYLSERFREKEINLILFVLTSVGFLLRKDVPGEFKFLITSIYEKANSDSVVRMGIEHSRVRFMLETLAAIKNNNSIKASTQVDISLFEHFRKVLRGLKRGSESESVLPFGFQDVLKAEEMGRWWVVGSAWVSGPPNDMEVEPNSGDFVKPKDLQFNDQLLEIARKCRMNTDLRRTVFCIIASAQDYLEAFEKLLKLGLKGQREREIVHICISCCLREKKFNPYYSHLLKKFCKFHRRFQLTTQFALWDRIKELKSFKPRQIDSLALLTSDLISDMCLCLSVLKVIDFAEIDSCVSAFLKKMLMPLFTSLLPVEKLTEIFGKIAKSLPLRDHS